MYILFTVIYLHYHRDTDVSILANLELDQVLANIPNTLILCSCQLLDIFLLTPNPWLQALLYTTTTTSLSPEHQENVETLTKKYIALKFFKIQ